jgi:hypothetical protein
MLFALAFHLVGRSVQTLPRFLRMKSSPIQSGGQPLPHRDGERARGGHRCDIQVEGESRIARASRCARVSNGEKEGAATRRSYCGHWNSLGRPAQTTRGTDCLGYRALFSGCCCRKEVIGFQTRQLGVTEPASRNELGQDIELFEQLRVKSPAALISWEELIAVCRSAERVPSDENRARREARPLRHN